MKKISTRIFLLALAACLSLAACDTTSTSDTTSSSDCAITGVTLGTLLRTINSVSPTTGADTTYTVNVTGSLYPMYIDQLNNRIYNVDSLPVGTQVDKVVFSSLTSSGTLAIQSLYTGNDTIFSATDSTDFRKMRVVRVYSSDGQLSRLYDMEVNIHNEEGDSLVWKQTAAAPASALAAFTKSRLLSMGTTLYAFGEKADGTVSLVTGSGESGQFSAGTDLATIDGAALNVRSVQLLGTTFYALAGNALVRSADGTAWEKTGTENLAALAGTSADSLYALTAEGRMVATADGTAWTAQQADAGEWPLGDYSSALCPTHTNKTISSLIFAGYCPQQQPCVWKHDIDAQGIYTFAWNYLPQTEELNEVAFPIVADPSLISYDDGLVLVGRSAEGKAVLYRNSDIGRTWVSGEYTAPAMAAATSLSATVDANHFIWIICGGTGEVWRGRINRLAWKDENKLIFKNKVRR